MTINNTKTDTKNIDLKNFVNHDVANIQPSVIRKFFDLASQIEGVVSLGIGEPDFTTPRAFCEAGYQSLLDGKTGYSPNPGIIELRRAIADYQKNLIGVTYSPINEIIVTVGASEAIDATFRALLNPGDEVIIPEPAFVSYESCVRLAGGIAVPIPTSAEQGFKITPEQLAAAITPRTKAVVLNFPGNPTGVVMSEAELAAIGKILVQHGILAISDEIYAELTYNGKKHCSIAAVPGMRDLTILISGFSKSLAMTGQRIGYVCAHPDLLGAIYKIHQFSLSCANITGQYIALYGLTNGQGEVTKMRDEYDKRRRFMIKRLAEIGLAMCEPEGAFYAFPSIKNTDLSSTEFCERLLREEKVACIPGNAFGESGEGFIRCSYATSMENLIKACDGIERFINKLK